MQTIYIGTDLCFPFPQYGYIFSWIIVQVWPWIKVQQSLILYVNHRERRESRTATTTVKKQIA